MEHTNEAVRAVGLVSDDYLPSKGLILPAVACEEGIYVNLTMDGYYNFFTREKEIRENVTSNDNFKTLSGELIPLEEVYLNSVKLVLSTPVPEEVVEGKTGEDEIFEAVVSYLMEMYDGILEELNGK